MAIAPAVGPLALVLKRGAPSLLRRGLADHPAASGSISWTYSLTPTVGGTIYCRPRFTITVNSSGVTEVRIKNTTVSPNTEMIVTYTFLAGDVLVVDSDRFTVTVNGVAVDFYGQFVLLDPRAGTTNTILLTARAASASSVTLTPVIDWTSRYAA